MTRALRRFHPYARNSSHNPKHKGRGLIVHSKIRTVRVMSDAEMVTASGPSYGRQTGHEAYMIPGVDGTRTFGFPSTILTKLRYVESYTLTSTTGSMATQVFRANSIFDPDQTGVGHQPLYRDQYADLYNKYVVIGSKITAYVCNTGTASALTVGIVGDDDGSFSSTSTTRMEQSNSTFTMLGKSGSGNDCATLVCTYEPRRDTGVDAKSDGSSSTSQGSNPSDTYHWALWCTSSDQTSTNVLNALIEIEYTVKFSELVTPTQS